MLTLWWWNTWLSWHEFHTWEYTGDTFQAQFSRFVSLYYMIFHHYTSFSSCWFGVALSMCRFEHDLVIHSPLFFICGSEFISLGSMPISYLRLFFKSHSAIIDWELPSLCVVSFSHYVHLCYNSLTCIPIHNSVEEVNKTCWISEVKLLKQPLLVDNVEAHIAEQQLTVSRCSSAQ